MPSTRILAVCAFGLALGGCAVSAEQGYWDARLAELPVAYNYGCRDALMRANTQEAVLYCPPDMPLPPNGVWKPGLVR